MAIKFKGVKKPFDCVMVDDPPHSPERARWSDGHWADICTRHIGIFRKNLSKNRAIQNPVWFLRGRKKQETNNP